MKKKYSKDARNYAMIVEENQKRSKLAKEQSQISNNSNKNEIDEKKNIDLNHTKRIKKSFSKPDKVVSSQEAWEMANDTDFMSDDQISEYHKHF